MTTKALLVSNKLYDRKIQKPKTYILSNDSDAMVIRALCIICVIVYIIDIIMGYSLTAVGLKDNDAILSGDIYRLFTCTLLHSGIFHLLSNVYFINLYGQHCEYYYGHKKTALILVASGFTGSLCSFTFTDQRSVGASGIAFGILGAILAVRYAMPLDERRKVSSSCIWMVVVNLVLGFLSNTVDNAAHIGGFIGGMAIGYALSAYKESERKGAKMMGSIAYMGINTFLAFAAYTDIIPKINFWGLVRTLIGF